MASPDQGPDPDPSTFVRLPGCSMRQDPCYHKYAEALQCLDKNDYQQDLCAEAFQAFKACRSKFATVSTSRMSTTFENDPLLGWAFRMYKDWTTQKQQQLEQQMQQQLEEERRRALQEPKPWRPAPAGQQQHGGSSNAPDKA